MRNYSLLEDIYLGDIEKIEEEKGKRDITLSECVFAVECYNLSPDKLNHDIAKAMFDGYLEKHNSKEDINDLVDLTKNISRNAENFLGNIDNEHIKKFIVESKLETNDFLDEDLRLDSIILKDKSKIERLIELETFKRVLRDHLPLEQVGEVINLAKQSADMIIAKNQRNNSNKFAPLAVFLAEDIVETLVSNMAERDKVDAKLWDNVERYDLNSIKNADLEEMSDFQGPQHLAKNSKEPIYEASWVLLESGDLKFASTYFGLGNHRPTCHTDLANGESVVSAGMAYFSADKKSLLAIDNKSGHYQPSLESVFKTLPAFEKSDLNTEITIVANFGWDEPQPFKANRKSNDDVGNRIEQMRAKSFPNVSSENNNLISPTKR
jgi:hypothetical protein